ncbi:hypothetical protein AVEN_154617-1 [Araneus ventricosus]|uniref:Uncharacterized protein n=1 Tax=Araneus ventricosus TaxID=182803 RepID=A0A4Y2JWA5_ARAVE|nr:hypothetical protein AVEN_154617-1 [Araneus ventricosus]
MPKRKRGITGDAASRREAIRKRERRVVETEEEKSRRLSTMAQRGQERRAEEVNWCTDCTVYRERSVLLQNSWPNLSQDLSSTSS